MADDYFKKNKKLIVQEHRQTRGISSFITPGIVLFLGYLWLSGVILLSKQTTILALVVLGIWLVLRR